MSFLSIKIIGIFGNTYELDTQTIKKLVANDFMNASHNSSTYEKNVYTIVSTFHNCLSPKESICLYYLMRGQTSKEIAKRMSVSPKTIDNYITHINNKFGCVSRTQLIEKAYSLKFNLYIPEGILSKSA